jgi:hypothetical protein
MKDFSRRLKNIERKLSMNQQTIVLIHTCEDKEGIELPEKASGWLIYPEKIPSDGIVILFQDEEIGARKKLQKTTKSRKIRANKMSEAKEHSNLTDRQLKTIPHIISSPTYTEGCKKAKVNKTTFYNWLKEAGFKAELDRQRDEVTAEAFGILSQSLTKAVETLAVLLDNKDIRPKRLAAKDVIVSGDKSTLIMRPVFGEYYIMLPQYLTKK